MFAIKFLSSAKPEVIVARLRHIRCELAGDYEVGDNELAPEYEEPLGVLDRLIAELETATFSEVSR